MNKYTNTQLQWMHTYLDKNFCEVVDGVMTNLQTGEDIPVDLLSYQTVPPDGLYELGESTCGGGMPMGFDEEKLETIPDIENPTEADKDKYQCRVGRRAPLCTMYSKKKCAVYNTSKIDLYDVHINVDKLIAIANVS